MWFGSKVNVTLVLQCRSGCFWREIDRLRCMSLPWAIHHYWLELTSVLVEISCSLWRKCWHGVAWLRYSRILAIAMASVVCNPALVHLYIATTMPCILKSSLIIYLESPHTKFVGVIVEKIMPHRLELFIATGFLFLLCNLCLMPIRISVAEWLH